MRKITSPLPGFASVTDILIPSRDGRELYVFNSRGRHLKTLDAVVRDDQPTPQPVVRYAFGYDQTTGRLTSINDANGNTTEIVRNQSQITITGPFNQQTAIALDGNGYVASITDPNGDATEFTFSAEGRLDSLKDPENHITTFSYDTSGRLTGALYPQVPPAQPAGDTLVRSVVPIINGTGYEVTHQTAEGVSTVYRVEFRPDGTQVRTTAGGEAPLCEV